MDFKDKVTGIFWAFLFLTVMLQLYANQGISFLTAFSYSTLVVLTLWVYLRSISGKAIGYFLASLNPLTFLAVMAGFCLGVTMVLAAEGYAVIKLTVNPRLARQITEDALAATLGLFLFTSMVSGLNYTFEKYKQYLERERELEVLKRQSLEMEISLLRNQLSPHFTFNILNNLQFLIRKDTAKALHLLSHYSRILRYYVYESQKKSISLDQEIAFLKEYFALEISRQVEDLKITCTWAVAENELHIVPFVLSAFVENAFKHVLPTQANDYFITACCVLTQENRLHFHIRNSFDPGVMEAKPRGVGLKHVEERLRLSYPDRYRLALEATNETFSAKLELTLEK